MTILALLLLLAPATQATEDPSAAPKRPAITIRTVETADVQVFHLTMPWGPETFAAMERAGEGFYNRRSWPFARMETTKTLKVEETSLPAGNYALVFHPNTPKDEGMSLEVRKIAPGEFLQAGNVMTRTPEGETLWQAPVQFTTAATTAPTLEIRLLPDAAGFVLDVHYGDRQTAKLFESE
jgi:hypothetical protein